MIIENSAKTFEKPDNGMFIGTVIDVVDLGKVKTNFGEKVKVRIVWVLDKNDSEGNPYRVMRQCTASVNEKAALYEVVKSILGTAPPAPFDSEVLIGRANQLYIVKEKDKNGKEFANVKLIAPLPTGTIPPAIPQGFVRAKDRPAQGAASTVGTTQTAQSTAQGQANPAPAVTPPAAAQPAASPVAAPVTADAAF